MSPRHTLASGHRWLTRGMATTAEAQYLAAANGYEHCGSPAGYLEALTWLAEARYRQPGTNSHETTKRLITTAIEAAPSVDSSLRSRAFEQLARLEAMSCSCELAADAARRIPPADPARPRAQRWALVGPAALRDKRRTTRRILASVDAASPPEEWWTVHTWMLVDALEAGDRVQVDAELEACRRLAARVRDPFIGVLTRTWESAILLLSGEFREAEAHISTVMDHTSRLELNTPGLVGQLTHLAWERGQRRGAIKLRIDVADAVPDRSELHRAILAETLAADGRTEEASFELNRLALDDFSRIPLDRDWLPAMVRIAQACARLERDDLARQVRALLAPLRDRTVLAGGMPYLFLGAVAHYTGALAVVTAELDSALVDLAAAVEIYERLGARPWLAAARCEQARALLARADRADVPAAQRLLERVAADADALGMQPLSERVARLLGEAPSPVTVGPTFCRQGGGWTVAYATRPAHLPDTKGMSGLHYLLQRPGVAVPALTIATEVVGDRVSDAERARVNVTRQMRSAINTIGDHIPELAAHLTTAVVTGYECQYRPPTEPPMWQLSER